MISLATTNLTNVITRTALLVCLITLTTPGSAAQDRWENYYDAGVRALNEGDLAKAELLLKASRLKAELEERAGNPRAIEMRLESNTAIALVLRQQGKIIEAEQVLREHLDLLKSVRRGDDDPQTSMALHNLGLLLFDQRKYEDAKETLEKAVVLRRKYDVVPQRNLATSLLSLGGAYFHLSKVREAQTAVAEARDILFKIVAPQKTPADQAALMRSDHNLALIYVEQKKYEDAEKSYKAAITAMEELFGPESPGLITYLSNYNRLLQLLHRSEEARVIQARVDKLRKRNE